MLKKIVNIRLSAANWLILSFLTDDSYKAGKTKRYSTPYTAYNS